jgi:hypothetical protein
MAASPRDDTLAAYPLAVVDQALRVLDAAPHGEGGRP